MLLEIWRHMKRRSWASPITQDLRETIMGCKLRAMLIAVTLLMVGVETAHAGIFDRLLSLERRKNEWLRSVFFRR
jgi:hypothetical protein